jgi:diguanylate cyclase (GGDEF)-like protein/putative nucleotidyltransferase with HDIG domain
MAARTAPQFRGLPRAARLYIAALCVAAAAALAVMTSESPGPHLDLVLFGLAVVLCSGGNLFEVFAPGHYSLQINFVFFFWGAVLLPPWAVAVLALLCFVPGTVVHRVRWYMTAFNVANYVLAGLAAHWILRSTDALGVVADANAGELARLLLGAVVFVIVNHLLLLVVVSLAQGRPLRSGLGDRVEGMPLDTGLAMTGACLATLWHASPWLAALMIGPMFLIYRALWLPLMQHKARTDPKTGLYNSDHLMKEAADALARAKRRRLKLSVVMIDLDHLRAINNQHGHLAGDRLIRSVAEMLAEVAGSEAIAARFGGEEFCVLLPEVPVAAARRVAETLRSHAESIRLPLNGAKGDIGVTISVGVAGYPEHGDTVEGLLHSADAAVYEAKLGGRNRVRVPLSSASREIFDRPSARASAIASATGNVAKEGDAPRPRTPAARPAATRTRAADEPAIDTGPVEQADSPRRPLIPWYASLLCLGAVLIGLFSSVDPIAAAPVLFAVLVATAVALDVARIDLFERANISPASVATVALAMQFGPLGPLASEGMIAAIRAVRGERVVKWAWDLGALTIAGAAAAWTYAALPHTGAGMLVAGGAAAGIAYFVVNTVLLSVVMGMSDGRGSLVQWREGLAWLAPHFVAFGTMAGTFLLAEEKLGAYVVLLFGVPIALLWVAQKQYLDRSRKSVDELRRNAEQLGELLVDREHLIDRMHRSYLSTITSLARSIEARDPYTGGHTERVSAIAHALAAHLGFDEDDLRAVEVGSIVHDIGKIGIPDEILLKQDTLSEEEFDEMRKHTDIASYILADLDLPPIVKQMARSHHERYDGAGYPDGLLGEEIPLAARILTVADALDAMTSNRPYRPAMPLRAARAELEEQTGTQFCPRVAAALRECLDNDPAFRQLFETTGIAA